MSRARNPASLGVCMDAVPKHSRRPARSSARTTRHELRVTGLSAGSTRWRMPCHPSIPTTHQLPLTTYCIPNRHKHGLEMPVTPFPATKVAVLIATDWGWVAAYIFHQTRRPTRIVDTRFFGVRPGYSGPQGLYLQTLPENCTALPFLSSRRRPHRPFRGNPNGLFSRVTGHNLRKRRTCMNTARANAHLHLCRRQQSSAEVLVRCLRLGQVGRASEALILRSLARRGAK